MPKVAVLQTNFTGGELSPYLLGRVDVAKYGNGVARLENFHPVIQGGALSRGGTRYLGRAAGDGRLVPFVFSRTEAYQIEFTGFKLRVWFSNGLQQMVGNAPLEIETPYDLTAVRALTYEQAEDTMFLFHTGHMTRRLQRVGSGWRLDAAPFVTYPFGEQGHASTTPVTLSDVTVGTGRTLTAAGAAFNAADVGREFTALTGVATVTGFTDTSHLTVEVTSPFVSPSIDNWKLLDSPSAFLYASQKEPVGAFATLHAALPRPAVLTLSDTEGSITVNASAAVFTAGDTGRILYADAGTATLTYVSATECSAETSTDFLSTTYQAGMWGITGEIFRPADVGSFVRLNGGLFKITSANGDSAVAEIRVAATALVAAPQGAWSINQSVFGGLSGYPGAGALYEQRLVLAGTLGEPQGVWFSRIGEYLDFEPGLNDGDGFGYKLALHQRNPIVHLAAGKRLFALTSGMEVSLRGGNEKAIGPTNIQKENESAYGASHVRPIPIGKEVVFVQGGGRRVRALGYSAAIDGFDSPDRTVFAEHVTESGIIDMAYQPQPHSLLHAVRDDGQMAVCAYDVGQEVISWSRFITNGFFRSVSVIPTSTVDAVWVLVKRDAVHYVERFEPDLCTDCASTWIAGLVESPRDTLTGLERFNGQRIEVKADGAYMGSHYVKDGAITLNRTARSIEAGLAFLPQMELLPPEVSGGAGSSQGSNVSVHEVVVRVLDTQAISINGQNGDFRRFGSNLLDQPPPGFTGDARSITLSDALYRDRLVISQPQPMKAHVLSVVRKLTVNDT